MECKICGNRAPHEKYVAKEMMLGLRKPFSYFQCGNCNCLQIEHFPSDIYKYYPDQYHSFEGVPEYNPVKKYLVRKRNRFAIYENSLLGKLLYRTNPEPAIRSLSKLSINRDTKILDVGCGSGKLLFALKDLGFENLTGIDPYNSKDIISDDGVKIWKKNIHEVQGKWDLIMMHHAFEHVPDPLKVLVNIAQRLKSSGSSLIRIPVVNCYAWETFRENWVQLDAPRHFFLHSVKSLEILAEEAGLELREISYDSTAFQFWGSIQYEKDIPLNDKRSYALNPGNSIFSKNDIRNFSRKAQELNDKNNGDQAVCIFRKQ